jgi:hypothetical protein
MPSRLSTAALVLLATAASGCVTLVDNAVADAISAPAEEVRARHGAEPMPGDPQTLMTRKTRPTRSDRARAERLLRETREAIRPYRTVEAAEAAGYRMFPPEQPVPVVHFVHREWSEDEQDGIDPERPGALLYERTPGGGLRLLGAMFTAPVGATLEEMDRRVPLSVTQWHLHQNICVPRPLWDEREWERARGGRPLFGPGGSARTEAACDDVGGRFLPTVFGWMAHVNVFAEDPADVWNAHYGHGDGHGSGHGGMDHGGH